MCAEPARQGKRRRRNLGDRGNIVAGPLFYRGRERRTLPRAASPPIQQRQVGVMKLFECQHCGQLLYFENTRCERCGHRAGLSPRPRGAQRALPRRTASAGARWSRPSSRSGCAPMPRTTPATGWCRRTRPERSAGPVASTARSRTSARRSICCAGSASRPPSTGWSTRSSGSACPWSAGSTIRRRGSPSTFSSPKSPDTPQVMTGHATGLITINIAEADDAERERIRQDMGEPYRTLLGHFRHEVGHYYWDRLVRDGVWLARSASCSATSARTTARASRGTTPRGRPPDWQERFVSGYASAHPWEDFAETWAHYLHIVDTLETAAAFGLRVRPDGRARSRARHRDRLRSLRAGRFRRPAPGLAAAHLRGQQPQPEHGPARPLSLRPGARRDGQAALRPRPDRQIARPAARSAARGGGGRGRRGGARTAPRAPG